jgi:hypothetical protein
LQAAEVSYIDSGFNKVGIMVTDSQDTGGARTDNWIVFSEYLEKMTHQTTGRLPFSGIKGKLAATGLIGWIIPGNL